MKRIITLIAAILLISNIAVAKTTMKYSGSLPVGHHLTAAQNLFAEKVASKTNGEIEIKVFPAQQLYSTKAVPSAVVTGALEIGYNLFGVWTKDTISEINDVPFLIENVEQAGKAWDNNERLFKYYTEVMKKRKMKPLGVVFYGSLFDLTSPSKIVDPSDFKGKKIRTYSALASESIRALGGSPVTMAPGEMYLGLQNGTIDAAITGLTSIHKRKLWETGKYATIAGAGFGVFAVNMNLDQFNKLSKKNQKALLEASNEVMKWSVSKAAEADIKSMEFLKSKINVTVLNSSQKKVWVEKLEPVKQGWLKKANSQEKKLFDWVASLK
jgi:TRAP-type C4-dicarboxylate transport system substrate-binding protein